MSRNSIYDGLGRLTQTQLTSDPEGTDYVDTTYDALGRVYSVSNPHRSAASSTDGTTYHYYDALGRIIQVGIVAHSSPGVDTYEDYQEFVRIYRELCPRAA